MRIRSPEELGLLVRQERKDQHLSQEALAQRIGASRQWVRMLEQGKPRLELGLTLRALTALGLTIDIQPWTQIPLKSTSIMVRPIDIDHIIERARRPRS